MNIEQINEKLLKLVVNERRITNEILQYIAEFYKFNGHAKMGYSSIIQYLTKALGYSEDQAYRRWAGAKLLIQIPEAAEKIASGQLNLSQAACAQKAFETASKEQGKNLSKEIQKELLESLAKKNNFDTQKILCEKLNLTPQKEDRIRPQSDQTVRLEIVLTAEQYEKFKQVKSLLSHQIPDQKNADILETICDLCIKNKLGSQKYQKNQEPQKNEQRNKQRNRDLKPSVQEEVQLKAQNQTSSLLQGFLVSRKNSFEKNNTQEKNSRYIPANFKRIIFSRAEGKCEYVHSVTGVRCNSTYQLEYDHIQPIALGGKTELGNIRLCCRSCNTYAAWSMGIGFETTSYFSMNKE